MPRRFFWIQLAYLTALCALFVAYHLISGLRGAFPDTIGPLPFEVPFFGALGGALISMAGVVEHHLEWKPRFNYWHYTRPLIGAVAGSVGCLLFYVILDAANRETSPDTINATVFDVVAFLVGYREETFRELIKRATDILLGSRDRDEDERGRRVAQTTRSGSS